MFPFMTEVFLFVWNRLTKTSDYFLAMSKCVSEITDEFMQNNYSEFITVLASLLVKLKLVAYVIVYRMRFKHVGSI